MHNELVFYFFYLNREEKKYLNEKLWWYLYKVENRFELGEKKKQKKGEQLSILLLLIKNRMYYDFLTIMCVCEGLVVFP